MALKLSFALAIGFVLVACGGGEGAATVELPKETKEMQSNESFAELQQRTLRGFHEGIAARDANKVASLFAESGIQKVAGAPADANGRAAIAQAYQRLFDAFSDFKAGVVRTFVKGDVVVVEWAFNATHTGDLWGNKGSQKPVGAQVLDILWFTPDGQIKEDHLYYDGATILSQIGVTDHPVRPIPGLPTSAVSVQSTGSLDEAKNVEILTRMNLAMDSQNEAEFLALIAEGADYEDMTQAHNMKGLDDAKAYFREATAAFPDGKTTFLNSWAFDDFVVMETSWTGTNKGAMAGMPATNKSVTFTKVDVTRFKDGKMTTSRAYSNGADFMRQLGLM